MGTGLGVAVLGAILAFAVRAEPEAVDLRVVGLILMIAGGILIWHAKRDRAEERVVTKTERPGEGYENTVTLKERITDKRAG